MLRTVWKKPSIRWTPNGNQVRTLRPSAAGREPAASVRASRRGRSRGSRRSPPTPRKPPAQTPGRCHRRDDGLLAPGAARRSMVPSSSTHQKSAGVALLEQLVARVEANLLADVDQLGPAARRSGRRTGTARGARRRPSDRRQVLVHEVDRHRALADGRRDALHRVESNVAGGEDTGHARLEQERWALERPRRSVVSRAGARDR